MNDVPEIERSVGVDDFRSLSKLISGVDPARPHTLPAARRRLTGPRSSSRDHLFTLRIDRIQPGRQAGHAFSCAETEQTASFCALRQTARLHAASISPGLLHRQTSGRESDCRIESSVRRLTTTVEDDALACMRPRYRIRFPPGNKHAVAQDEISFVVIEQGEETTLRFHEYAEIYSRPGLYEQLFYDRLKCTSPKKVSELLRRALDTAREPFSELRVLDLGAGNGMMGEVLKSDGVARLVGTDIIVEAREAAYRDRPAVYDDYYVADFTRLEPELLEHLREWHFDCLTCVAALGFGDIPPVALFNAMKLLRTDGWLAFNIKDSFLDHSDQTGFSRFIRELIFSEYLDVSHLELYRHRLSMEGEQLFYYALVGRLTASVPDDFLREHGLES